MCAFSPSTRIEIRERADNRSELSGKDDRPLQCSHFNHKKKSNRYDKSEMGLLVTDIEHLVYHLWFRRKPKKIGLCKKANESAIKDQWINILSFENRDLENIYDDLFEGINSWENFFEERKDLSSNKRSNKTIQPVTSSKVCDIID